MGALSEKLERELVADFLKRVKGLAHKERLHFANREANNKTLGYLGIKYEHAREIILNLTAEDYTCGVGLTTKHEHEERCDFGVYVDRELVYVKLIIDNARDRATCVSFHIARWDVPRKFREGGDAE
jgi:hypothetical protein